jgi:biopolymer transport protein ExbD
MNKKFDALIDNEVEQYIDMTPMLDIISIMLIFFIVNTSFVKEPGIKVDKPQASTAKVDKKVNIIIGINKAGEIWINKKIIDLRQLRSKIEELSANFPKCRVIIDADKHVETGLLVSVMDQVKSAGISKISIGATHEQ